MWSELLFLDHGIFERQIRFQSKKFRIRSTTYAANKSGQNRLFSSRDKFTWFLSSTDICSYCTVHCTVKNVLFFYSLANIFFYFFIGNIGADVSVSLHHRENTATAFLSSATFSQLKGSVSRDFQQRKCHILINKETVPHSLITYRDRATYFQLKRIVPHIFNLKRQCHIFST